MNTLVNLTENPFMSTSVWVIFVKICLRVNVFWFNAIYDCISFRFLWLHVAKSRFHSWISAFPQFSQLLTDFVLFINHVSLSVLGTSLFIWRITQHLFILSNNRTEDGLLCELTWHAMNFSWLIDWRIRQDLIMSSSCYRGSLFDKILCRCGKTHSTVFIAGAYFVTQYTCA